MSRDKRYQRLLNDKRWLEVKRMVWHRSNGLCEDCMKQGIIRAGVDCHHVIPVETARTIQEMKRLCYNPDNIRLLCIQCHSNIHRGMGKGTRKLAQEREKQRQERWSDNLINQFVKQEENEKR